MGFMLSSCCHPCTGIVQSCEYSAHGLVVEGFSSRYFWDLKETNWPNETPVFDAYWGDANSWVSLTNKGATTLVFDSQDPLTNFSRLEIRGIFKNGSLVGEAGVCFILPWESESISLWWLGDMDFELRRGPSTVLHAWTSTTTPYQQLPANVTHIHVKLVITNPKSSTTDVECWIHEQLDHTETGVSWEMPELLDYGVCVNGAVDLWRVVASPCGRPCVTIEECGVDVEAPEIWLLNCPPIINKANDDPDWFIHCQDSVSDFFSGEHVLIKHYSGKTQGLVRANPNSMLYPVEYEWIQCPDHSDHFYNCTWVAVITESMGLGTGPYLCYKPEQQGGEWVCNREIINNRDSTYYPIKTMGHCSYEFDDDRDMWLPTNDYLGHTVFDGYCDVDSLSGPNSETWWIVIRRDIDLPQWQRDQEPNPVEIGSFQIVASCYGRQLRTQLAGPPNPPGTLETVPAAFGVVYYSGWYNQSQPIPSSDPITLTRGDIRYPTGHPGYPWDDFYTAPDTITVTANGTGNNDSYTRFCRGLTCQPILDPEENREYIFTMTYELPDLTLLVDEPVMTAYFQEEEDSWVWYGSGQPMSLAECPGLGSFIYHIHCIKEANGGRGQWVLDISTLAGTSRLNMIVDEELGITFEGTVTSGCDGQDWEGIGDELKAMPVPSTWGSCLPKYQGLGVRIEVNCMFDPISDFAQVQLTTVSPFWTVAYENTTVRAANFQIGGEWFAIAVWPISASGYTVEIRKGVLRPDISGNTNWNSLQPITSTSDTYFCHPEYGYPILAPTFIPYAWGNEPDPVGLCPGTYGNSEFAILWN